MTARPDAAILRAPPSARARYTRWPQVGLVAFGRTRGCARHHHEDVPSLVNVKCKGWVTRSNRCCRARRLERVDREAPRPQSGRTQEIQLLIGRSLRAVTTWSCSATQVIVDSILMPMEHSNGAIAAVTCAARCVEPLVQPKAIAPIRSAPCAAISVAIVDGPGSRSAVIEDSRLGRHERVMIGAGGTTDLCRGARDAEGLAFTIGELDSLLCLASWALGDRRMPARCSPPATPVVMLSSWPPNPDNAAKSPPGGLALRAARPPMSDGRTESTSRQRPLKPCACGGDGRIRGPTTRLESRRWLSAGVYAAGFAGEDATYTDTR